MAQGANPERKGPPPARRRRPGEIQQQQPEGLKGEELAEALGTMQKSSESLQDAASRAVAVFNQYNTPFSQVKLSNVDYNSLRELAQTWQSLSQQDLAGAAFGAMQSPFLDGIMDCILEGRQVALSGAEALRPEHFDRVSWGTVHHLKELSKSIVESLVETDGTKINLEEYRISSEDLSKDEKKLLEALKEVATEAAQVLKSQSKILGWKS